MGTLSIQFPPITTDMIHAPLLSIISTNNSYLPWFISNYIQLFSVDNGINFYNFVGEKFNCPWLLYQNIHRETFFSFTTDIHEFIKSAIDKGNYILITIDEFYICNYTRTYQQYHSTHPLFIYGYNNDNETYNAGEFFSNGKFEFSNVNFAELYAAFMNCDEVKYEVKGISILKYVTNPAYKFDQDFLIYNLYDYFTSQCKSAGYHKIANYFTFFGMEAAHIKLIEQVGKIKDNKRFDLRVFPILCDHKKVLRMALAFLSVNKELSNNIIYLGEQHLILQNLVLKYLVTNKKELIINIEEKTRQVISLEKTIAGSMINYISNL